MCSVAGPAGPAIWGSASGFHRVLAMKPVSSETSKPEWRSNGDHSSIWDSWPMAFSGHARGPRVGCETRCRSTQCLTYPLRLALEPECPENPRPPPEKIPRMERTRSETLKLFVVSDVGRRSSPLSSIRSVRSWQFFVPRSVGPFLASCLWPIKPCRTPGTDRVCWRR
jgi:hypothetical protein